MWMWWLFSALAAPASSQPDPGTEVGWIEVVARSTNPSSARWTAAEAAPFWDDACTQGRKVACTVRDGATLAEALSGMCPLGDDVLPVSGADTDVDPVACLGRYWRMEVLEPEAAFAGYRSLCEGGLARACAEVARAHADGVGTFVSQRRARRLGEGLCADGVAAACVVLGRLDVANRPRRAGGLFDKALSSGDVSALWEKVPVVATAEAAARLTQEACDAGHPMACIAIAEALPFDEGEQAQALVGRSCDLGSPIGCLRDMLTKYENDVIPKRELQKRLESLCLELEDACIYAGFLGFGGDVRAFFPGYYPDTEKQRITGQIVPFANECLRDFRDRNPIWGREIELTLKMWVDEEGVVQGVVPVTDADLEYQQCVAKHGVGVTTKQLPDGGAALVTDSMTLGIEADIVVSTFKGASGSEQVQDLENLAYDEWTETANACYMENGGSAWDNVFTWIYGEIMRDGTFVGTRLIESTGDEATDACVLKMLQGIDLETKYAYNERVRIYVRFNVVYRAPRSRGKDHGKAADPDTYMYDDGGVPRDIDY